MVGPSAAGILGESHLDGLPAANVLRGAAFSLTKGRRLDRSDDSLVADVQAGRSEAFDTLMKRYEKLVCRVALNYVRERQSALDVTQNVFLKAYRHIDRVRADGMFKPWLLRIAYNESISQLRRRKPSESTDVLEHSPDAAIAPAQEERLVEGETRRDVLKGLEQLGPKYKLALSLRYGEGLRVREIAQTMECSEGMVKSLLFRGVRQLRSHMAAGA